MTLVTIADDNNGRLLPPGTQVEVRNRFDGRRAGGFEVAEIGDDAKGREERTHIEYWLRRHSDGTRLGASFISTDIRLRRSSI